MNAELYARLHALVPRGADLGLVRMQAACARLGHPEAALRAVHVAGTNGKGSVCAMVDAMARAGGIHVGTYTSPHLGRFAERIRIDGEPIDDAALEAILAEVLDAAPELTFFEVATLAAFIAFARARVELAIVEVGLGGRLDATSVLPSPVATAVTRIAMDHQDRLGDTLGAIAWEKASIARRGVPMVVGPLLPEARRAVVAEVARVGATLVTAADDPEARRLAQAGAIGLAGAHQVDNAQIAVVLGRLAGLDEAAIVAGLRDARWPGRLETLATDEGPVLLDAAHNPDGARALGAHLDARGMEPHEVALVFGAMADKDWREMLAELAPRAAHRLYVTPGGRTAAEPAALAAAFGGTAAPDVPAALREARARVGEGGLVVVAGSIFLVGEARALLLGIPRDPPVAL